jgi:hypothetical protein
VPLTNRFGPQLGMASILVLILGISYGRRSKDIVDWWNLVGFPYAIPKQTFILWLALHNRLTTGDRLLAWGYNGDMSCVFYRNATESKDHLFL